MALRVKFDICRVLNNKSCKRVKISFLWVYLESALQYTKGVFSIRICINVSFIKVYIYQSETHLSFPWHKFITFNGVEIFLGCKSTLSKSIKLFFHLCIFMLRVLNYTLLKAKMFFIMIKLSILSLFIDYHFLKKEKTMFRMKFLLPHRVY